MLEDHLIVGIHITNRVESAVPVQNILTAFGTNIKTRVGLHEAQEDGHSSPNGLILVEFLGGDKACDKMMAQLKGIDGVDAKKIVFTHS